MDLHSRRERAPGAGRRRSARVCRQRSPKFGVTVIAVAAIGGVKCLRSRYRGGRQSIPRVSGSYRDHGGRCASCQYPDTVSEDIVECINMGPSIDRVSIERLHCD